MIQGILLKPPKKLEKQRRSSPKTWLFRYTKPCFFHWFFGGLGLLSGGSFGFVWAQGCLSSGGLGVWLEDPDFCFRLFGDLSGVYNRRAEGFVGFLASGSSGVCSLLQITILLRHTKSFVKEEKDPWKRSHRKLTFAPKKN